MDSVFLFVEYDDLVSIGGGSHHFLGSPSNILCTGQLLTLNIQQRSFEFGFRISSWRVMPSFYMTVQMQESDSSYSLSLISLQEIKTLKLMREIGNTM